jgi:asparaginyl-tRNA synthetase
MQQVEMKSIGRSLADFQAGLREKGRSFEGHIRSDYADRWTGSALRAALGVRTTLVLALQEYLVGKGLVNIDRVSLSPVTDPLCHDVEHAPVIPYKGVPYRTTHSMIYGKMLACMNEGIEGIFVDSPNIRLELASRDGSQRGKYLVDFSQMDVEFRRKGRIGEDMYFDEPETVARVLEIERDRVLDFFEGMIRFALERVVESRSRELEELGMRIEVPSSPFPRYDLDEALAETGGVPALLEEKLGRRSASQLFWITGLVRENYDLVYPYLRRDGKRERGFIPSREVYNYDLCAKALRADGSESKAYEVLSGGLREWVYPAIVERLIDNGIIRERPAFTADGCLSNMEALEGYGPFLAAARLKGKDGVPLFPETAGGGLGIERCLFALLNGPKVRRIEDITFFGKNPDSSSLYLF